MTRPVQGCRASKQRSQVGPRLSAILSRTPTAMRMIFCGSKLITNVGYDSDSQSITCP